MISRTLLILESRKLAFRGGVLNRHTSKTDAWLPKRLRPHHHDAPRKEAKGQKPPRVPAHPLRDEPLRQGAESKAKELRRRLARNAKRKRTHGHLVSHTTFARTALLLDHDKST